MQKKRKNAIKETKQDAWFDRINTLLVIAITLICAYPIYYTVIASFSDPNEVILGHVFWRPIQVTLDSYRSVFEYDMLWIGYRNTLFYTVVGTAYNLFVLLPASYSLSRKNLKGRNFITKICLFTMYFSGGTIPVYLLIKSLGLIDNPMVMILPGAFSVYNMIITRTFFSDFPEALCEAAKVDGASEFRVFMQIVLPLSGSIVAVMTLKHAVDHWNTYYNALLYLGEKKLFPLQLVLREVLMFNNGIKPQFDSDSVEAIQNLVRRKRLAETMKYSLIVIANLPILVAYPFVQKHFVKGVMIGSVKG